MKSKWSYSLLFMIWSFCLPVLGQGIWEKKISKQYMGQFLYNIFKDLEGEYSIQFDFDRELITNRRIPIMIIRDEKLSDVIAELLEPYDMEHRLVGSNKVLIRKGFEEIEKITAPTRSNFRIEGVLVEMGTGETLPFATIKVLGTTIGATSNVDGFFSLDQVPSDTSTLQAQYLGFQTLDFKLYPELFSSGKRITVEMNPLTTELEEVIIAEKREHMMRATEKVSMITVSPRQLDGLPSLGEKDIFRSMQLLPGISATNETSSGLYVRGGTPDQNLVLFDGFNVYHVDHFYGFFSAFNANAVKNVQLYKGGFEAKYGGRISSVVDLTGRDGNEFRPAGSFGISALSVNGSYETPFANGKGTTFVAARRSYTDVIRSGLYNNIFDLFQEEDQGNFATGQGPGGGRFAQLQNEPSFHFYDLNAKVSFRPTDDDILEFSIYNGQDKLDNSNDFNSNQFGGIFGGGEQSFSNETIDLTDWGNVGSSLKWSRQWNNRLYSNSILSYSNYFSNRERFTVAEVSTSDTTFTLRTGSIENNDVKDFSLKSQWEYTLNQQHDIGFGAEVVMSDVDYSLIQDDTTTVLDRQDNGFTASLYLQDTWRPMEGLSVSPGLRLNYYNNTAKMYVEPRLSLSYQVNDQLKLKGAWGQFNQFVTRVVREDVSQGNRDFWLLANEDLNPVSSATHYILGASYETNGILFDIEGYRKNLSGLSEYTLRFSNNIRERSTEVSELFYEGEGYSEGIEFLVQKKFGKHTGWISYTLSQTIYDFPGLSENPYPALHDQTHEFKFVENVRLKNWTLGATWVYATGKPFTQPLGSYDITLLDGNTDTYLSIGEKNGQRLPSYHRLDLSITHDFSLGGRSKAQLGFSIFNLYNNTNVWYKTYDFIDNDLIETDVTTLGMTPNVFFNLKF